MKTIAAAGLIVLATLASTLAQTRAGGSSGTWQVDGQPGTIVLKEEGGTLTGLALGSEISDGRIEGNSVTFKVQFPGGGRTVTFTGTINGDRMTLAREVRVPQGAQPGGNGVLGAGGPMEITMNRVSAANIWTGTIRTAPNARNPAPNPNPRTVSLGSRKVPSPHWRWRGGEKEIDVRTFTLPMGTFELNTFDLAGERLSYSYSRPNQGDEVVCQLTRQPQGRFDGTCRAAGGGFNVLIDLTPPAPEGQN